MRIKTATRAPLETNIPIFPSGIYRPKTSVPDGELQDLYGLGCKNNLRTTCTLCQICQVQVVMLGLPNYSRYILTNLKGLDFGDGQIQLFLMHDICFDS